MTIEAFTYGMELSFVTLDDNINELGEYFQAELSSQTNGLSVGTNGTSIVNITDNDGKQFSLVKINFCQAFTFKKYSSFASNVKRELFVLINART